MVKLVRTKGKIVLEKWKLWARKVGDFQARLILTVFYFTIIAPFALVVRWGTDPLSIKPGAQPGWRVKREPQGSPIDRAAAQF